MTPTKSCVDTIAKNDREGINEIYQTIRPQVFRYFYTRGIKDINLLEDVFQEAILNIFLKAKKGDLTNTGSCFGLIKHFCFHIIGNRKQKKSGNEEMFEHFDKFNLVEGSNIEKDLIEKEKDICFWNNLRKMSPDCIQIITMRMEGEKHKTIADHLGISNNAATVRFFKCLKKLTTLVQNDPDCQDYLNQN